MPSKRLSLSTEKIVSKAVEIADKGGIEELSMRKLAGALGATAMSLYNHVPGKERLFELMLDRVMMEFELPDVDGDWEIMMERRAISMHVALRRHQWATMLLITKSAPTNTILRDTDAAIGCLVNGGFSYPQADWAYNAIDSHVIGYTIQEQNYPIEPNEYAAAASHFLPQISSSKFPFARRSAELVAQGEYDGKTEFGFGLRLVLDGLKRGLKENTI